MNFLPRALGFFGGCLALAGFAGGNLFAQNDAPVGTNADTNAVPESTQRYENLPSLLDVTKKEAFKGDPKAQADFGVKFLFGEGIPADPKEAIKWFQKSANQKNSSGQYWMGYVYYNGKGV